MTAPRRRTLVAVSVAALMASACGSTVQHRGALGADGLSASAQSTAGDEQRGLGGSDPAAGGGTAAASSGGSQAGRSAGSAGVAKAGTAGGPAAPGRSAAGPVGPGITAKTVSVGVLYQGNSTTNAGAQFGAKNLVYGDLLAQQKAVVDYINSHGGVAGGRTIDLVAYDATSSSNAQAVCSYWTEDHKVFAGIYPGGQVESDVAASCMANHRAIYIQTPFVPGDQKFLDKYATYLYTPSGLEAVTMGGAYVGGLLDQGFFAGGHKLGLLYYDVPSMRSALERGVKPALAKHGIALAPENTYAITYAADAAQNGSTVSAIQNAELKFATNGVDRVMFLDAGAGLAFFFIGSAKAQSYKPRYGFMSGSNPSFIGENYGPDELSGSLGVGWLPAGDVALAQIPDNPARALCRQIMSAAGQTPASQADLYKLYDICATFFLLRDGLNKAASLNASGFQAAVESMGPAPQLAAASFDETYGPGKHWGAASYSGLAYDAGCSCFKYTGSPRSL